MDRQIVYPGQILPETTLLQMAKDAMIGVAKLSAAVLGTSTMANGFAVTPTGPASLQVVCAPGEIYSLTSIDALAFSTLPADTTHSIMKQGILLDGVTLSCPAPGTTGQSINYLIQVTYQDSDSTPVLLPYYNSANPALPYSGMGNNGLTQNTNRKGVAIVAVKAGASAVTGSQVTPAPDAGYIGLYVVTVAFGQTTITAGSIAQYSGAPLLPAGLLQSMQSGQTTSAADIGLANAYAANFSPAITALSDKMVLCIKAVNANTAASTFTPAPGVIAAAPIVGGAHAALQGGEIVANGDLWLQWNSSIGAGSWVLIDGTGGGMQVAPATKSQHAVQLSQMAAVVGGVRNGKMSVAAASATATFTADEVAVKTALGGAAWLLPNFSKTINLAATGAGAMDTGAAPASGFVAIYAIYNPATGASALLARNAATLAPEVYGSANMPAGYTASALVSVWPTNASGQLVAGIQVDRQLDLVGGVQILSIGSPAGLTSLSIAAAVPANAKSCKGYMTIITINATSASLVLTSGATVSAGQVQLNIGVQAAATFYESFYGLLIALPQTIAYVTSGNNSTFIAGLTGYTI